MPLRRISKKRGRSRLHSPPAIPRWTEERNTGTEDRLAFSRCRHIYSTNRWQKRWGRPEGGKPRASTAGRSVLFTRIDTETNKQTGMSPFLLERIPIKRRPLRLLFIYLFIFTHRFSFTGRVRTHPKNFYFHFSLWKLPPSLWSLMALKQSWRIKFIFFALFL